MPCLEGVYVSLLMNLPGGMKVYGLEQWLVRAAETVEKGRDCIQCGECEARCPYQLPIREVVAENIAFYERMAAEQRRVIQTM